MSPFDTIFGAIMVAPLAVAVVGFLGLLIVGLCKASGKPAPRRDTFEASPYGPVARMCELRGHQYGLSSDGRYFVCVRGDDRVARIITDLDDIENYANRGGAA